MIFEWMRKYQEAFLVAISRVRLDRAREAIVRKQLPILAVVQISFNKNAFLLNIEILAADNLTDEVDFWNVVTLSELDGAVGSAETLGDLLKLTLFLLNVMSLNARRQLHVCHIF